MKKPKLSIITVNWNGLEYLKKCVEAIQKFTKDYELIIVDNNSDDGSVEYLNSLFEKNKETIKVRYLKENVGWVGGINEGLELANGEYICFINNDIEVTEDWFEKMQAHFIKEDKVGMVGATCNFTMGLQRADLNDKIEGNHHKVKYLIGWLMLTTRKVLEDVAKKDKGLKAINGMAGLDPVFGIGSSDDLDLSLRIRKAGYTLFIAREVFVYHHGSKSFAKMFGEDLCKSGTEANKKYMADVDAKLDILRKKWGEDEIKDLLTISIPKSKFIGTIGTPHGELIPHRFHTSIMSLAGIEKFKVSTVYGSLIHVARNELAKKIDGDYLLFIDSDMTFEKDSLQKLLKAAERDDVDIVGAACFRKVAEYEPCFFWRLPSDSVAYYRKLVWDEENLFEVDGIGSAFTLIKKKVFDKIPYPWYEYTNALSEDLNFCRKAKEYGFKIWVDPTIKIGHLTMMPVDQNVFKAFNAKKIEEYKRDFEKYGEDPIIYKLKNNIPQ